MAEKGTYGNLFYKANLSALSEEIEDLVLRPLCNRPGLRGGIDEK